MTTAPITVSVERRPTFTLLPSPLVVILALPRTDFVTVPNVTITAADFPVNQLTEITAANVDELGTVPGANSATNTSLARAAYDYIESGANLHVFALPFPVDAGDTAVERNGKVVVALNTTLGDSVQRAKLPRDGVDVIVVPGETAIGTAADNVYAALETLCDSDPLGCVSLVDAGGLAYDNAARPDNAEPTAANVKLWSGVNRNIRIYAFSNRGDVANYNDMWGSVIAAAHHARYVSRAGIHAHPFNLRDPVLGVAGVRPQRVFDPGDGSSSAIALDRDDRVGSLVLYDGADFIWGGESYATEKDPRQVIANHIVANRMVKFAKRQMARYLRRRATGSNLEGLRLSIEVPLQNLYRPRAVQNVQVRRPVYDSSGKLSVRMPTAFHGFIQSIELTAEVYNAEVA